MTAPPASVTPAERRWVWAFAGLVLLFTGLPYLIGYAAQGAAYRFSGFVFALEDGNSYIAKMLTGTFGDWLFRSPYSAMPQRGVFLFPLHLWLGKLAAGPALHEQLVALYQLFRLLGGLLLILATYDFLAYFIHDVRWRRWGLALATLGGGMGWVALILGQTYWFGSLPLDIYSPETFGFLSLYGLPHLALARAGMLWTLLAYLRLAAAARQASLVFHWRQTARLGALWLLVTGLAQPLTLAVTGVVIAVHLLILALALLRRRAAGFDWGGWLRLGLQTAAAGLLPGLLLLYTFWISHADPYVAAWTAQNVIRSPHPLHYLLAYGLIAPYAALGAVRWLRDQGSDRLARWLPLGWLAVLPLLVYLPLDLQRRLAEGVWVAWVTLAMAAFDRHERPIRLAGLPLGLAFLTAGMMLLGGGLTASRPQPPLFTPRDEARLFETLQTRPDKAAVVLAAFETSNTLPAYAPVRVLLGHGPESVGASVLQPQVADFYRAATPDAQRLGLIRQYHIRFVVWGPAERALGDWQPQTAAFLRPLAGFGEYYLFEVTPSP